MELVLTHPYKNTDWGKQWKANLHTHTKYTVINGTKYGSDGVFTQAEVIDAYHDNDYDILAITDHSTNSPNPTYPWTVFSRDPETLGMLAIQAQELSYGHHRNSLFCDLGNFTDDVAGSIAEIKSRGGLCIINHPGRYAESDEYYINLFLGDKKTTIGLEVHNQGNKYPNDRQVWDRINAVTIPQRKIVYGYANDDMHEQKDQFKTYNFILAPELTESAVRTAMENGQTYFCYEIGDSNGGSGEAKAPRISNIVVDETAKTVTVTADSGTISWVTEGTIEVGTGTTFDYTDFDKSFFRAVITNEFGITYTQPFAFAPPIDGFIYDGNDWIIPTAKVYDGERWVEATTKIYDGGNWVEV